MQKTFYLVISLLFIQLTSIGQDSIPEKINFSGFLDAYYSYNFNQPKSLGNWGSTGVGRVFDGEHDHLALNIVQLKADYESKQFDFVGDFIFGPGAELAQFGNKGTSISVKQAYGVWKMNSKTQLTFGQFGTHIGYELVDAPDNFHYSLSYLFANGPFYHMGLKLNRELNDKVNVMIGLLNGWDHIVDNNNSKTFAGQINFTPNDKTNLTLNYIGGNEDPITLTGDSISDYKQMADLVLSSQLSAKFKLTLNSAFGVYHFDQSNQYWGGTAIYLEYLWSKKWTSGVRAEFFDDSSNVQYLGAAYQGYTLTLNYVAVEDHLHIKPEFRLDNASRAIYSTSSGMGSQQSTVGIAMVGFF